MEGISGIVSKFPDTISIWNLVELLADLEPEAALQFTNTEITGDPTLLSKYYSSYLLALIITDDLNEARFLTHRFPPTLSDTDELLLLCKDLLRAVWTKQNTLVYQILQALPWPEDIRPLASCYLEHFRENTFYFLSRAYTSLPPRLANEYLGLTPQKGEGSAEGMDESSDTPVVELLASRGWKWDATKGLLFPVEPQKNPEGVTIRWGSDGDSIGRLVGLVGFLGE